MFGKLGLGLGLGKQKYAVIAESGRKMGTYSSKKQAQKRLAQVVKK